MNTSLSIAIFVLLWFCSCSLQYEDYTVDQEKAPQMVMQNFRQVVFRKGKKNILLYGHIVERNEKKKQLKLQDFSFEEYDEKEQLIAKGKIGLALVQIGTNDAIFENGVDIWSENYQASLRADTLSWQDKEKILIAIGEKGISLTKKNGSEVHSKTMEVNFRTDTLKMMDNLWGVWKEEEKGSDQPSSPPNR